MPIKINFLAERIEAEAARRKDPVLRSGWWAASLVLLVLLYSGTLKMKQMKLDAEIKGLESEYSTWEPKEAKAKETITKLREVEDKIGALYNLGTNRFLWGPVLNAIQFSMIPNVNVTLLQGKSSYVSKEKETKKVGGQTVVVKPARVTETVSLTIGAKCFGTAFDSRINQFKDALLSSSFFEENITNANNLELSERSMPQTDPAGGLEPFVVFNLQCRFPPVTR
ncbi:MAG: hypothetical protein K9N48_08100 [Verrucomicrobia bacterium]|nr:hypothetical protein [Verrucomicrobiota bacterium]MCF7709493.1 hypothetical protein [Verrucomicrobiota bacterium]